LPNLTASEGQNAITTLYNNDTKDPQYSRITVDRLPDYLAGYATQCWNFAAGATPSASAPAKPPGGSGAPSTGGSGAPHQ
jgi:hypothetical protein